MMKHFHSDIPWKRIRAIGFDMDGTLYNEYDFIQQVYGPIAEKIAMAAGLPDKAEMIYKDLCLAWKDKGSSYPYIFSETLAGLGLGADLVKKTVKECLSIFRAYEPRLNLSTEIRTLLMSLKDKYSLFLVTDGSSALQWSKINALGLDSIFEKENIFVSGDHADGAKPGLCSLEFIPLFRSGIKPQEVVYIGDRDIDREYAIKASFYFMDAKQILSNR